MPGCTNKGKFAFHKFPRDIEICKKWQHIARRRNIDPKIMSNSHYRICSRHFKNDDYATHCGLNKLLKKNVLPSLFIPKEDIVLEEHNYSKL